VKGKLAKEPINTYSSDWTYFEEPADKELNKAFDLISNSSRLSENPFYLVN